MKRVYFIAFLISFSFIAQAQSFTSCPDNNHPHMIDLGLDDGTLWACCNVGATVPEDYGDYFAWGETSPKDFYYWNTYKWCEGSQNNLTKYNFDANYGAVDNRLELELENDAAYMNWWPDWHMPSIDQVNYLVNGTTHQKATLNGVDGFILRGKNGNSIFIPDAGAVTYECAFQEGRSYWTRTLDFYDKNSSRPPYAIKFNFTDNGGLMTCCYERWRGYPVRAVALVPRTPNVLLTVDNFPDTNFRKVLAKKYDVSNDGNGIITAEKIAATGILNISNQSIANLAGIGYFKELTRLYCDNNQLSSLNLSENPILLDLNCSNNQLNTFNTSKNINITSLNCSNNRLTSLDVSNSVYLSLLDCSTNQLTMLDISRNRNLDYLYCSNNLLTSLNVSSCWHLRILTCFNNKLTSLNGLSDGFLAMLSCYSNQIKGSSMDALINSLWKCGWGPCIYVVDTKDEKEGNVCTKTHVAKAQNRGWVVCDNNGGDAKEYEGADPTGIEIIYKEDKKTDSYYTLDGKLLDRKPTQRGVYIKNGHKVVE